MDFMNIINDEFIFEASNPNSHIVVNELYHRIERVLSTSIGDRKFRQIVGNYIDRNSSKLYKAGPMDLIPFGDVDKAEYFNLFQIDPKEVVDMVKKITTKISKTTDFKLLVNNPIFWVFWCCIRYYTLKKDQKGLNASLAIYALAAYPSIFSLFFKHGVDEGVMQ
jgi:hypothetical protein